MSLSTVRGKMIGFITVVLLVKLGLSFQPTLHADHRCGLLLLEFEPILILILDHIWATVHCLGAGHFLYIGTGSTVVLLISVASMCPSTQSVVINVGSCSTCQN